MIFYWPRAQSPTYSNEFEAVTYDPPQILEGGFRAPILNSPSSCVWMVPGTHI